MKCPVQWGCTCPSGQHTVFCTQPFIATPLSPCHCRALHQCNVPFCSSSQLSGLQLWRISGWGNIFLRLNVGFLPQIAVSPAAPSTPPSSSSSSWCLSPWQLSSSSIISSKRPLVLCVWCNPANQSPELISSPSHHPSYPLAPHISSHISHHFSLHFQGEGGGLPTASWMKPPGWTVHMTPLMLRDYIMSVCKAFPKSWCKPSCLSDKVSLLSHHFPPSTSPHHPSPSCNKPHQQSINPPFIFVTNNQHARNPRQSIYFTASLNIFLFGGGGIQTIVGEFFLKRQKICWEKFLNNPITSFLLP